MNTASITSELSEYSMQALCNTLFHSFWQGLLLSLAGGLIVVMTKRSSPNLRYNLLVGAMVLFLLSTAATFILELQLFRPIAVAGLSGPTSIGSLTNVDRSDTGNALGITAALLSFMRNYHNNIILIWVLIICAKCIQLAVGFNAVNMLRKSSVTAAPDNWNQRVQFLARQLNISKSIGLFGSGLTKVPMVIGHLKPVILIPAGMFMAVNPEALEAILVHELAHIRRKDYLVNLLQSFVEIVFFFNPGVLWISTLIKTEREYCCDDIALSNGGNKKAYIRALLTCEEYSPDLAVAFAGKKGTLLERVKRIVEKNNSSLNYLEKGVLGMVLLTFVLGFSAFREREHIKTAAVSVVHVINTIRTKAIAGLGADNGKFLNEKNKKELNGLHRLSKNFLTDTVKSLTASSGMNTDTNKKNVSGFQKDYVSNYTPYTPDTSKGYKPSKEVIHRNEYTSNYHDYKPEETSARGGPGLGSLGAMGSLPPNKGIPDIVKVLVDAHVIANVDDLAFHIDNKEFTVNGTKQTEELHQKILQALNRKPGSKIDYTYDSKSVTQKQEIN